MEKIREIGVLFSGGLDSTYLIWDNLRKGNRVYPFYFTIKNNLHKPELEKNRINLLYKSFYETYGDLINPPEYVMSVEVMSVKSKLHLQQLPVWILGLQYCQMDFLDETQIGYVMNDDAISYIDDIRNIYQSYNKISDNQIPLEFPLIKHKKEEIYNELPKIYRDLTITCENPTIINSNNSEILDYESCGTCAPCIRNISIRNYFNDIPESYNTIQIENSIKYLTNFGKIINEEDKNNNFYITFEFPLQEKLNKPTVNHKQLKLDFGSDFNRDLEDITKTLKQNN